ncbi:MAG: dUTP diphosphatase, partial [Bacteroidota bacterium]
LSNEEFVVQNGDRIAQMIVSRYEKVDFRMVETLDETRRNTGGYGHTGTD